MTQALMRTDYRLADSLEATSGQVFLTGTQALIRLALMQAARDAAHGIGSAGFISGYRGSPLGMVDQAAWKAAALLDAERVRFLPAINEELGATAVLGTQRVESDPERTADGVFAHVVRQGTGRRPRRRRAEARQRLRLVAARRRAGRRRRRPRLRLVVDAAPERPRVPGLADADRRAGQRRRVPVVRPVRLGAVALLRQLGRLHRAVGGGRERQHGRPRRRRARGGGLAVGRRGRAADRLRASGRRPALPLARSAVAEDRGAPAREARGGARVRAHQLDRPRRRALAARVGRHRDLRQGAPRPARGVPPPRHLARRARRCRRAALQGRPVVPGRADAAARVRRRARRDPRRRGEGRRRRGAAARPALQRADPAARRRQARCGRPPAGAGARRAAAVAADRARRRVARGALRAARPPLAGRRLHGPAAPQQRRAMRSSGCRTSAPAARTARRRACRKARARRPASAATSWPRGWTATPPA